MLKRNFLLWAGLFLYLAPLNAQKSIQTDEQIWVGGQAQARLTQRWGLVLDAQVRSREQFVRSWALAAVRPGLVFFLNEATSLAAGYAWFGTYTEASSLVNENRLWQQIQWQAKISPFGLQHRFRLEERWVENPGSGKHHFNYRMRYMLALAFPLTPKKFPSGGWQLLFNDEIMINFGKEIVYNTFDQNRIYAAVAYQFSSHGQIQAGYMYAFQQRVGRNQYLNLHVIRLLCNYKIDWRKPHNH